MSGALPTGLSGAGGPVSLIKVPALLTYCRLASSNSEAQRKLKEGAVKINGAVWTKPVLPLENKGLQRIDGLLKWRLEIQLGRKQTIVTLG
jgi:tyrosyl-tRNA synthetase